MLNQVVLVGRVKGEPVWVNVLKESLILTLSIPRAFKNENGIYDTDTIKVVLKGGLATNVTDYLKNGNLIGVKGRVEENSEGSFDIVGEKITYLSSSANRE